MKLEKGKRYWCGWACRYATFERIVTKKKPGQLRYFAAQFVDVTGVEISCDIRFLDKWVRLKK